MITVVCPVYNEEKYIQRLIDFFLESKPFDKELLLIDGGSTDETIPIIQKALMHKSNIHLIYNKHKYVPYALNLGIKNSNGDPIVRLDAHTYYSNDYFEKILETFEVTGADIVGGHMNAIGNTSFQQSVAFATSTKFGVGNSKVHELNYSGESDHVYLGAWKRNIFEEVGFFDERLKRNQDDEFHYRAKSLGKKIFLNPNIKSYYFPRENYINLFKQYFQYGYFKPIVLLKIKSEIKFRHLIPLFFVLYIISLFFIRNVLALLPFFFYIALLIRFSLTNKLSINKKILTFFIYPTLHISYGLGFLIGLLNFKRLFSS